LKRLLKAGNSDKYGLKASVGEPVKEKGYNDFVFEMRRFLPSSVVSDTVNHEYFWTYLLDLINDIQKKL